MAEMIEVFADRWGEWTRCNRCGSKVRWTEVVATGKRRMFTSDTSLKMGRDEKTWRATEFMDAKDAHGCAR